MNYGERIKLLRAEKGLSQGEMAIRMGKSLSAYKLWENGTNEPSISAMIDMADYFEVTVDYLIGRSTDSRRTKVPQLALKLDPLDRGEYEETIQLINESIAITSQKKLKEILKLYNLLSKSVSEFFVSDFVKPSFFRGIEPDFDLHGELYSEYIKQLDRDLFVPMRKTFTSNIFQSFIGAKDTWRDGKQERIDSGEEAQYEEKIERMGQAFTELMTINEQTGELQLRGK